MVILSNVDDLHVSQNDYVRYFIGLCKVSPLNTDPANMFMSLRLYKISLK